MARYYAGKKKRSSRGWLSRNIRRAKPIYNMAKKRYAPTGQIDISKIQSDISYATNLAKTAYGLLNTEKQRYESNWYDQTVGQVNGNNSGHKLIEFTPTPSQGTGFGSRRGSSISFRSMFMRIYLNTQSTNSHQGAVKFMIVQTRNGDDLNMTQFLQYNKYLYAANTVAIYDMESQRDPDYFGDFRVLRTKIIKFNQDSSSGAMRVKTFNLNLNFGKKGKHIRFNDNGNTPVNSRFWLVVLADSGNYSPNTNSTLNAIPIKYFDSGFNFNIDSTCYFIDN